MWFEETLWNRPPIISAVLDSGVVNRFDFGAVYHCLVLDFSLRMVLSYKTLTLHWKSAKSLLAATTLFKSDKVRVSADR